MTTYKGYEITQCASDRFIVRLNGEHIANVQGSLGCAHFCIDSDLEDRQPQPNEENFAMIYKGFTIVNDENFIMVYAKDGSIAGQGYNGAEEAMQYIDREFKEPVDAYEGLELTEGEPTSEEINEALGVKEVCSFTEAVEANVAETRDFIPVKERQLTEAEKQAYYQEDFETQNYYELERSQNMHI